MSQIINETFIFHPESLEHLEDWILETVHPAISDRVLETESGKGNFSAKLVELEYVIELNASSEAERDYLKAKFKDVVRVRAVHRINFRARPELEQRYLKAKNTFPTVIAIGDLLHYNFHESVFIRKAEQFLSPGGNIIITGRCKVDLYPGSDPDPSVISINTLPYVSTLLTNCELLLVKYFNWKGLSFLAVGQKRTSEIE